MEGIYDVFDMNNRVGHVDISRDGLYFNVCCHCQLEPNQIYKLFMIAVDRCIKLGTLIPRGSTFSLHKRVPIRQFSNVTPQFCIIPRFVPLQDKMAFPYLHLLKNARLRKENGQWGIVLDEM